MKTYKIKIRNIYEACQFVKIMEQVIGDVDLSCGSYKIDGKSIIGVISLAGNHILQLSIHETLTPEIELELERFRRNVTSPSTKINTNFYIRDD